MRVLHVHDRSRFQGGVEQIMFDLACGLGARGWPQGLWCAEHAGDARFDTAFERICTTGADAAAFAPDVLVLHKWTNTDAVAPMVARYASVQVVHDHDFYCPRRHKYFPISHAVCSERAGIACARHLCLIERRPGVFPIGLTSMSEFRRRLDLARCARVFVAGSRYSAGELKRNGFAADRIRVIAPVPAALAEVAAVDPSSSGDPGRMLFVGQVIRGKGLDLLLRAAARLTIDWHLDVVGEGRQLEESRELAARLGIQARVRFAGWVPHEDLGNWYARASLTVVPSRWPEPFGMIGLESMARGRPVVGFDSGGISDWLADGKSGILVPAGDVSLLAAALTRALSDGALLRRLGAGALRHCHDHFSHPRYLDAMQSAISGAAAAGHGGRSAAP